MTAAQGQESKVVIVSMTRTTHMGFLEDAARINVSLSRAQDILIVVQNWDDEMYSKEKNYPYWSKVVKHHKETNSYARFAPGRDTLKPFDVYA